MLAHTLKHTTTRKGFSKRCIYSITYGEPCLFIGTVRSLIETFVHSQALVWFSSIMQDCATWTMAEIQKVFMWCCSLCCTVTA